jgi:chorismate synthase
MVGSMAGSVLGKVFRVATWGESHGKGVGVVVDGCPAGLLLCEGDVQGFLDRRKPGGSRFATPRKEEDRVEILSGVFEGMTTGAPISMVVWNQAQQSRDYSEIAGVYRPGHADYTFDGKYGFRDYRGGGRSSGRETIARVAAGAVAQKILGELGVDVFAYAAQVGAVRMDWKRFDRAEIGRNVLCMPDAKAAEDAGRFLEDVMRRQDSAGGVVECVISGMPVGIGEPVFDKLDANLAKALMSIGAVKGVEVGEGFGVARLFGSENNDAFCEGASGGQGGIRKVTNHAGGILGGMSDGSDIVIRAAIKPTPSIARAQKTVNRDGENIEVCVKGRHDPVIVPRAVVVVECMAALTVVDLLFANMTARMEHVKKVYKVDGDWGGDAAK